MDKKDFYNECEKCGRSFHTAKTGCNYCNSCVQEYPCTMNACIKKQQPDCMAKAVIPSITVETSNGITSLANCFVHVAQTNTTFYVDDKHRPMIVWAGSVEVEDYDVETNEFGLKAQTCFNLVDGVYKEIYFDKQGVAHVMAIETKEV